MRPITMKLFSDNTDSLANPVVQDVKHILEGIAEAHKCTLKYFIIDHGMIKFQFDCEEATYSLSRHFDDTFRRQVLRDVVYATHS